MDTQIQTQEQQIENSGAELRALMNTNGEIFQMKNGMLVVKIADADAYVIAGNVQKLARDVVKKNISILADAREAAFSAHKAMLALEKKGTEPYVAIDETIKRAANGYLTAERLRNEAIAKAAQKKAQEEEEARAIETAQMLQDEDFPEAAEEELVRHIEAPPPVIHIPVAQPTITGMSKKREMWSAEIIDKKKALKYILANPVLIDQYVLFNMPQFNSLAKIKKTTDIGLPGVRGVVSYV